MQPANIQALLTAYLNGTLPHEEQIALQKLLLDKDKDIKAALAEMMQQMPAAENYNLSQWSNMANRIVAVDKLEESTAPAISTNKKIPYHRIHFLKTS